MRNPELDAAFERRGAQLAVAKALGVSKQTVNDWKRQGYVPSHHASVFEDITGVPREKACPDFNWGRPPRRRSRSEVKEGA